MEGAYERLNVVFSAYVRGRAERKFGHNVSPWSEIADKCLSAEMGNTGDISFLRRCGEETSLYREEESARAWTLVEKFKSATYHLL